MKNNGRKNLILDAILFLVMIAMPVSADAEMHGLLGLILLVLVVIHIIWHWKQIKFMYRQLTMKPRTQIK